MTAEPLPKRRNRQRSFRAAALLLFVAAAPALGQGPDTAKTAVARRNGFVIAPVLYYTPETLFSWGIVGIHYFQLGRSSLSSRLSHYRFNLINTQKEQTIAQVDYELYLPGGKVLLDGMAKYALFPDRFYGSGNRTVAADREDFNSQSWRLQLNLQRRWGSSFFSGVHLEMFAQEMIETADAGQLAGGAIPGSRGGTQSGLGLFGKWDSRDNTFSAAKGLYCALFINFFTPLLGGDFTFTQVTLDARKYFSLDNASVLAVQGICKTTWGDCPFQTLPLFGGLNLLRGYYEGRYRDDSMLALQLEYRLPLLGRFGLCGFAGLAQVQPNLGLLSLQEFHSAAGLGLRYKFNPREHMNVRLDIGFADSAPAFYLTFAEAF